MFMIYELASVKIFDTNHLIHKNTEKMNYSNCTQFNYSKHSLLELFPLY